MPFPQAPYNIRVPSVVADGNPVSGVTITLHNITKSTNTAKTSSESNSNITINLAECGDWDIGDVIYVEAEYDGNIMPSAPHTVVSGDNGRFDFGTLDISYTPTIIII